MLWSLENIFEKYLLSFYESCTVDDSILEELKVRPFHKPKGKPPLSTVIHQLRRGNMNTDAFSSKQKRFKDDVFKDAISSFKTRQRCKKTLEKHIVLHNFCIRNTIFGLSHGLLNISLEGHALAWIIFIFKSILLRNMTDCPSYYAFEMLFRWSSIN